MSLLAQQCPLSSNVIAPQRAASAVRCRGPVSCFPIPYSFIKDLLDSHLEAFYVFEKSDEPASRGLMDISTSFGKKVDGFTECLCHPQLIVATWPLKR